MKKRFSSVLALASVFAMSLMTACSDDSPAEPKPTKGEQCASGLSAACLEGTWTLDGYADKGTTVQTAFYSVAPGGSLKFSADKNFEFTYPDSRKVFGTWSVADGSLTLKGTVRHEDLPSKSTVTVPLIQAANGKVYMSMEKLWFMENETDDMGLRAGYGELYSISASLVAE